MQCLVRIQTLKLFTSRMKQSSKRKGILFPVVVVVDVDVVGCLWYFIEWLSDFHILKKKRKFNGKKTIVPTSRVSVCRFYQNRNCNTLPQASKQATNNSNSWSGIMFCRPICFFPRYLALQTRFYEIMI